MVSSHTLTVLLAVAVAAGSTGYVLGARSNSRQPVTAPPRPGTTKSPLSNTSNPIPTDSSLVDLTDSEGSIDSDSDAEDEAALIKEGKMGTIKAGMTEECKLVLVVNQELGMGKGKIAAQCSHATLACYKTLAQHNPKLLKHWERWGQAKVAVKAQSTSQLNELQQQATKLGLCARTIQDAGRTQIAAGSKTVLGIGPGPVKLINQVTGSLKLL